MRVRTILISAASTVAVFACLDATFTPTDPGNAAPAPAAARGPSSPKIRSVTVQPSSATVQTDGTVQLTASSKPSNAPSFVWVSSNQSVATVNQSGLVSGISGGTATVSATASGKSGSAIITVSGPPPAGETLWAAGDISDCNNNNDEATAKILDGTTGTVAILGDNAYERGSATEYNTCYGPTWGRHKARTRPSVGNHEYLTAGASGYFGYFGAAAGDPAKGYYSYDIGDWHVVVLNSNIARTSTSMQIAWLRADLNASTKACTLAYWHHPRFSSGFEHGDDITQQPFWDVLYELNADVVLNGHDHDYERFAPQTPAGLADNSRGIREFVVGTGGRALYSLGTRKANSQVYDNSTFGVLKLTLSAGSYSWNFIPVAGETFTDSGTSSCH